MIIKNLELIEYLEAYNLQKKYVQDVINGAEETLLICSHPSIVTLGKKSSRKDVLDWKGKVLQIERGGQATYHGPSQIIIYPIINLKNYGQNLAGYLEALESSMVALLEKFKLKSSGNPNRGEPEYTGVWVGPYKVASIGIAVKKWVTYHGLALNLFNDPLAFQGINPCGFSSDTMTSMERLLPKTELNRNSIERDLTYQLTKRIESLRVC